jgi:peptidoglycan/LPS O-acetylase OafA/YrhL
MTSAHHNNFDLIRLFAALQVLQGHATSVLDLPGRPDWLIFVLQQFPGVTVFFIVSGFLVTWSYLHGSGGLTDYFKRRALRIYPALYVNVLLIVGLLAITASLTPELSIAKFVSWLAITFVTGSDVYGSFVAGSIVNPVGFYKSFPSGVLWTIPIELTFYCLLPLILPFRTGALRLGWLSLLIWSAISVCVLAAYATIAKTAPGSVLAKVLSINPFTDLWIFLLGAMAAAYWDKLRRYLVDRFLLWLAAYLVIAVIDYRVFGYTDLNMHTPTLFMPLKIVMLAGVVLSFAFTWRSLASALRGNDLSYGIYLYHMPIILTLAALGTTQQALLWSIVLGGTLALAAASWYLIERPALRLRSRMRASSMTVAPARIDPN